MGPDPESKPRRGLAAIPWHKLPLANARRETRVGVAALASFLILVVALILNRGGKGNADPADPADPPSASGTLLAFNKDDSKAKGDSKAKDDSKAEA